MQFDRIKAIKAGSDLITALSCSFDSDNDGTLTARQVSAAQAVLAHLGLQSLDIRDNSVDVAIAVTRDADDLIDLLFRKV